MKTFKCTARIIVGTLSVILVLFNCFAVGAKNENYDILIESGFSEEYLDKLSESMIEKMAQIVIENSVKEENNSEKAVSKCFPEEVLRELSDKALEHLDAITGEYEIINVESKNVKFVDNDAPDMKTIVARLADKKQGKIAGEAVILYWKWNEKKPLFSKEDYIEVRWEGDKFCYNSDTFFAEDYYKNSQQENWSVADSYTKLANSTLNSIGHWTKVRATKNQTGGVIILQLIPTSPIDITQDYRNNIYVDYDGGIHQHEYKQTGVVIFCVLLTLTIIFSALYFAKKKRKKALHS